MRAARNLHRFTRGIVTDAMGVKGALLECDDAVPLERGEGWRTRGGKTVTAMSNGTNGTAPTVTGGLYTHSLQGSQALSANVLAEFATSGGRAFAIVNEDGAAWACPTQSLDDAAAARTFLGRTNGFRGNGQSVMFDGELLCAPAAGYLPLRCAGQPERTTGVPYATGTVSGSSGDATLTGSGTSWSTRLSAGCYIWIDDADVDDRAYRVMRVDSDTSVELDRPLAGAVAAATPYRAVSVAEWSCKPGVFGAAGYTSAITEFSTVNAQVVCQHQGRVFVFDTVDVDNVRYYDRMRWSAAAGETDGTHWGGAEYFHANAYQDVFPGEGWKGTSMYGVQGAASWRGALYVFKRAGIYVVRGYVATDGTDEGMTIDRVSDTDGHVAGVTVPVIATDEGIYFAGESGLMLLTEGGIRNISEDTGTRELYMRMFRNKTDEDWTGLAGAGVLAMSLLGDRLILHYGSNLSTAVSSGLGNAYVFDRERRVVSTQTTLMTTRAQRVGISDDVAFAYAAEANVPGRHVLWSDDLRFMTGAGTRAEDGRYPLLRMTTHPLPLDDGRGAPNGRVRAVRVRAKVEETGTALEPELGVSVLLGEEGTTAAVEAAISASSVVDEQTVTEKWHRVAVRAGSPVVDSVRVRLVQSGGSSDCRVTEVGVEHVPVARIR